MELNKRHNSGEAENARDRAERNSNEGVAAMTTADHIANGLGLIIDEHDAQYCLVAAAQKAFVNELDPAITAGLLSMLLQCTETHAMSEERLMQLCDFPEYAHHVRKDNQLVEKVQTILCTYQSGQRRRVADQLDAFADALNGHIGEDDAALQRYLLRFCPGRSAHCTLKLLVFVCRLGGRRS